MSPLFQARFCYYIPVAMNEIPRIALFADTFHEINGAANVLRRLTAFAKQRGYPFLCIRSGEKTRTWDEGSLRILELKKNRLAIKLDSELKYDPLFWRHKSLVGKTLKDFQPDVLHLTGISDVSQIGFYFAHFRRLPAVASWHTNGHEYAAQRLQSSCSWLPAKIREKCGKLAEKIVLHGTMKIYFLAQLQLAPNEELVTQIRQMTRRPSFLMSRGVDTDFLSPAKRDRCDDIFTIGYVGRLRPEKNVRFLGKLDTFLRAKGLSNYKFLIVGDGDEETWLRQNLTRADFAGVLRGEELARAFANMDLFVFPSHTDAFGNVVLEAMASGVPCIVMPEGGPKFLIEDGTDGFVADGGENFCEIAAREIAAPERLSVMKSAVRKKAESHSWENVFEIVFNNYRAAAKSSKNVRAVEDS